MAEEIEEVARRLGSGASPEQVWSSLGPDLAQSALLPALERRGTRSGAPGDLRPFLAMRALAALHAGGLVELRDVLAASLACLRRFPPAELRPEWLERAPLSESAVIPAGSLDPILAAPDLGRAGAGVARLLSVLSGPEPLLELFCTAAARDARAGSFTLEAVAEGSECVHGRRWPDAREVFFRMLEVLYGAGLPPASPISEPLPPTSLRSLLERRLEMKPDEDRALDASDLLFLAGALRAESICRLRGAALRRALSAAIPARGPRLRDAYESSLVRRDSAQSPEAAPGSIPVILRRAVGPALRALSAGRTESVRLLHASLRLGDERLAAMAERVSEAG